MRSTSIGACVAWGHAIYATAGSYTWTAPAGVTSVSVVCVGGGGGGYVTYAGNGGGGGALRYVNNIVVTPASTYSVVIGAGSWQSSVS